jgi:hypothetical protein
MTACPKRCHYDIRCLFDTLDPGPVHKCDCSSERRLILVIIKLRNRTLDSAFSELKVKAVFLIAGLLKFQPLEHF